MRFGYRRGRKCVTVASHKHRVSYFPTQFVGRITQTREKHTIPSKPRLAQARLDQEKRAFYMAVHMIPIASARRGARDPSESTIFRKTCHGVEARAPLLGSGREGGGAHEPRIRRLSRKSPITGVRSEAHVLYGKTGTSVTHAESPVFLRSK